MDPVAIIRYGFLGAAGLILSIQLVPALRTRFLAYGKTAEPISEGYKDKKAPLGGGYFPKLLDTVATIKTPRSWFTHFYYVCVVCNLFWGWQIATHGCVYQFLSSYVVAAEPVIKGGGKQVMRGQTVHQVVVTWLCFLIQGSRRIYECWYVQRPGTSKMWVGHYALGIGYYTVMCTAIWVEGTAAIDKFTFTPINIYNLVGPPSVKSFFGIILFVLGSGIQFDCHVYLASLKKYTLPLGPLFEWLVCPHYFSECLIYLALAILSAPRRTGTVLNVTMVTGLIFVGVNLGCSSILSREWYEGKFGRHSVERKSSFASLLLLYFGSGRIH